MYRMEGWPFDFDIFYHMDIFSFDMHWQGLCVLVLASSMRMSLQILTLFDE